MSMLFLLSQFTGFQSVLGDRDDLTRFNITDKFRSYRCQRAAFRCKDIGIISFSKTEGFQSVRITGTDSLAIWNAITSESVVVWKIAPV